MEKVKVTIVLDKLKKENSLNFRSRIIKPLKRYIDIKKKIINQRIINNSYFKIPQPATKSALDKNLRAKANSINPRETLIVFNQSPDFGNLLIALGNMANNEKGNPSAKPKPAIPAVNSIAPESPESEPARRVPKIGPVQEKETIARVTAMKKIPINPVLDSWFEDLFDHEDGSVNSKYPKKENAKTIKTKKNKIFK